VALERSSKVFLGVLVVFAGLVLGGMVAMNAVGGGAEDEGEPVTVVIPEGTGASGVASILADHGIIRSEAAFRFSARFDERSNRIQPGEYELHTAMDADQILEIISQPREVVPTFRVTIPEGLTVMQTLERIADAEDSPFSTEQLEEALGGVALPDWVPNDLPEGAEPFEGMLFPNTYEFRQDADPQDVLTRLVEETEAVLDSIDPPEGHDRYEVLIMASLVERETRARDEQQEVAGVIYNRLDQPMRLQIDATVIYARGEHTTRVLRSDTEIDSPWNTYTQDGLPPTPISGMGRAAIEAAANPAEHSYLYYVVCDTDTGEHAFAETLQGHNNNVNRYRQIQDDGGRYCDDV
jgi:UPF0755 protein